MPAASNKSLQPIPDDLTVLRAVRDLEAVNEERRRIRFGVLASEVAASLDIESARRLGRGAVKGSWSGSMSPALRIAPRLERLRRLGWIGFTYGDRSRKEWYVTRAGNQRLGEVPDDS